MGIEIREVDYPPFGRCVRLCGKYIEAVVSIEFGPRMLRLAFIDGENMLFEDRDDRHIYQNELIKEYFGSEAAFHCYGGHRLATAPDRMPQSYYPDNEPVVYGPINGGVTFTPPRQQDSDFQFSFDLMMAEDATDVMVVQKLKNSSGREVRVALAGVTMLASGGLLVVPQSGDLEEKHLPDRHFSLWPFSSIYDKRLFLGDRYLTMQHGPYERHLKFGTNDVQGWAAYALEKTALVSRFVHNTAYAYPDFGASFEAYVCDDYTETRVLSPLYTLEPGESVRHVENLALFETPAPLPDPRDEDAVEAFIRQFVL